MWTWPGLGEERDEVRLVLALGSAWPDGVSSGSTLTAVTHIQQMCFNLALPETTLQRFFSQKV